MAWRPVPMLSPVIQPAADTPATTAQDIQQQCRRTPLWLSFVSVHCLAGVMHPLASEVIKGCIPRGQRKPFPANCMSLMTVSGAKGSTVNFSQIACLLGQQVRCLFVACSYAVFGHVLLHFPVHGKCERAGSPGSCRMSHAAVGRCTSQHKLNA